MRRITRFGLLAGSDVKEIVLYIADDNSTVAQQFRDAFQETVTLLLDMPHVGSLRVSDKPALKDIRVVPVKGFDRYFIFYKSHDDGIEIVRVLHGARDYPSLFG